MTMSLSRAGNGQLLSVLRKMYEWAKPHRRQLMSSIALSSFSVLVYIFFPLALRSLINGVILKHSGRQLAVISLTLLGLFALKSVLSTRAAYMFKWAGEKIAADLRLRIYAGLHRCHLSYLTTEPVGDLTSRLSSDVETVRGAIVDSSTSWVMALASFVGSVVAMLYISRNLALVVLIGMPLTGVVARATSLRLQNLSRQLQDTFARTTSIADEALGATIVVKSFVREGYEWIRYQSVMQKYLAAAKKQAITSAWFHETVLFTWYAATVAVFWVGGTEVLAGKLNAGDLIAFIYLADNITDNASTLSRVYTMLNRAVGATERILAILESPAEHSSESRSEFTPEIRGAITFENVSYRYGSAPVVRNINLSIEPRQIVAIVGRSGAGKSTLAKLLCRFYEINEGRIMLDGRDIRDLGRDFLRQQIAFVPQDVMLFQATIGENIRYGKLDATNQEVEDAAHAANAHVFIEKLPNRYDTVLSPLGSNLSGGEKQRLAIARAFIKNSPIIMLDEPTSSIDSASETLIQGAIEGRRRQSTIIVIAHRLATVRLADQIFVLEDGQIAEHGHHDALMRKNGFYSELALKQLLVAT
jgi:ATP-binding cassette, subfamily B, bacterial MsbA